MRLTRIYVIIAVSFASSFVHALTREDVWGNALPYFSGWTCLVDSAWILDVNGDTIYPMYRSTAFPIGSWNIGEAYCWGGWDTPETFSGRINSAVCPGGYNTSDYGLRPDGTSNARYYLAGIDCAAFVNRCLQLPFGQGIVGITNCCLQIDKSKVKKGDVVIRPHHAALSVSIPNISWIVDTYESYPPKVWSNQRPLTGQYAYTPYSIFPQFANEKPTNGSEVYESRPEISVEVTGSGQIDIPYMLLDGNPVPVSCEPIQNGVKVVYTPPSDLKDGPHNVEIQATNNRVNLYEDEYTWSFAVHAECPVVVSTDPADGASEVDVYKNITITFNKEMDQSSVNSSTVLFSPALVGGFTPQWSGDNKTVTLILSDPQQDLKFYTNYTVTVTDGVRDIDGTQLDGDKDGKPGGNYVFSFTTREPNEIASPAARNDIEGGVIAYYFTVADSAGNLGRNPDTGYYYIIPVIPEGFSGHITRDTTWLTNILIKGDVWVDYGVTLTIGAGVKVKFIPNFDDEHSGIDTTRAEFIVQGKLALLGSDSMPVVFTSNGLQPQTGDWYGIRFANTRMGADNDTDGRGMPEIKCCVVSHANIGISCELNMPFKVKNCEISHCNIGVNSQSKITQIMETEFLINNKGVVISDGKLNLVKRCEFRQNRAGLLLKGEKEKRGVKKGEERENREMWNVKGETEDEIASLFCNAEFLTMTDEFNEDEGRSSNTNDDGKGQLALVFDNMITDNDTGIIFSDNALGMVRKNEITNNLIGVYITENAWPILGKGMSGQNIFEIPKSPKYLNNQESISSYQKNCSGAIYRTNEIASPSTRNDGSESVSYAVYNNTRDYILAEGNWWGTNNEDSIATIIWDFYDDENLGEVDFKPFREYEVIRGEINSGVQSNLDNGISEYEIHVPAIVTGKDICISYMISRFRPMNRATPGGGSNFSPKDGTKIEVHIEVYDIAGRLLKRLTLLESYGTGKHYVGCNNLTAGVYFIYFRANDYCIIRKVILIK